MNKIIDFFKNKAIGYYIVIFDAIFALILALIFLSTYQGAMANNAAANVPETIAIFLFAGMVVEIVMLGLPQYRFIHIIATFLFGLSLYKEIYLIPNLIADEINNVHYQGGDLGTNIFYLVSLFILIISAIVAMFLGFYKKEEDVKANFPVKGINKIVLVSVGGLLVLSSVLSSTIISSELQKKAAAGKNKIYNPITEEIKKAAEEYEYDFDPSSVIVKEQATWDYNNAEMKALNTDGKREGNHHIVYYFEGSYAEGYQGDYSEKYAHLWLWDDGLFAGKAHQIEIRGYWYNSSLEKGEDGKVKDCLNMVSDVEHYESIITDETSGFYERTAYIYLFTGGERSIIINGYQYYPEVAIFIDAGTDGATPVYEVGSKFDKSAWTVNRVLKNLQYSPILKQWEVAWNTNKLKLDDKGKFTEAGEFTVAAGWIPMKLQTTIKIQVVEKEAE